MSSNLQCGSNNIFWCLRTKYSRKHYIQSNFTFVAPVSQTLPLQDESGNFVIYQYVPLLETLNGLFTDPVVKEQFLLCHKDLIL